MTENNDQRQMMDLNKQDILTRTIISEKLFNIQSIQYKYQNKFKIDTFSTFSQNNNIKVNNYPCVLNGNQMKKVIQIQYGDRKYYIEDSYLIIVEGSENNTTVDSQKMGKSEQNNQEKQKKCCLFKKIKNSQINNGIKEKRNTKNIAKNFCKAFNHYLQKQIKENQRGQQQIFQDKSKLQQCSNYLKRLSNQNKCYNNNVIYQLISSQISSSEFYKFLNEKAQHWIKNSKITQIYKKVHYEAIPVYLNIYKKTQEQKQKQKQKQELKMNGINQIKRNCNNNQKAENQKQKDKYNIKRRSNKQKQQY